MSPVSNLGDYIKAHPEQKEELQHYARFKAKFILNDFTSMLHQRKITFKDCKACLVSGGLFDAITQLLYRGLITRPTAREILASFTNVSVKGKGRELWR